MPPKRKLKQENSPELSSKQKHKETDRDLDITEKVLTPDPKSKRRLVKNITTKISPSKMEKPVPETPAGGYSFVGNISPALDRIMSVVQSVWKPGSITSRLKESQRTERRLTRLSEPKKTTESKEKVEFDKSPIISQLARNLKNDSESELDDNSGDSIPDSPIRTRKWNSNPSTPMRTRSYSQKESPSASSDKPNRASTKNSVPIKAPDFEKATSEELAKYYGDLHEYYASLRRKSSDKPINEQKSPKKGVQFSPLKPSGTNEAEPLLKKSKLLEHLEKQQKNLRDLLDYTDDGDSSQEDLSGVDELDSISEKDSLNDDRYYSSDIKEVLTDRLNDKELLQEIEYFKGIEALVNQFPEYSKEDICAALYMTSGIFSFAETILRHDFRFTEIEAETQKLIFQPEDDLMLKNGNLVGLKKNKYAIDERLMFLGLTERA
ncbi:hypothetical protein HK103_002534 [Boothiomyces macroporosus]|uniref:Uncharacterized protein n=1 Tax=Boothiomyces macroporosus TaxID=261099 RepID=A0AAD5UIW0_9FUNG|nr:hypothetical protein HK103_002534 [Boothiomyces macroporosus]